MTARHLSITTLIVLGSSTIVLGNDWKLEHGYNALVAELGAAVPTGAGISVSHIEADGETTIAGTQYLPNLSDAEFITKTIIDRIGIGLPASGHATTVARYYYGGTTSMARDIQLIDCYEVNNWIGTFGLRCFDFIPPAIESRRIQNHSWIGDFGPGNDALTADALRRIDLIADRDGVVICAGVNNGSSSAMPKLACSAYNVIAVGLSNAGSSRGPTLIEAPGRVKPDLVAAATSMYTSFATPVVAAAAALLLETADTTGALMYIDARERRTAGSLLTKALLMAGASKAAPVSDWRKGFATPSTDGTVPLDYRYGAGDLNIYNSYHILAAGRQPASSTALASATGWDAATIGAAESKYYFFQVPAGQVAQTFSILLTWNRKIVAPPDLDRDDDVDTDDVAVFQACLTGAAAGAIPPGCADADLDGDLDVDQSDFGAFQLCLSGADTPANINCRGGLTPTLANLDLRLWTASGFTPTSLRDYSVSTLDNVEHIYIENLPAGTWAISVTSDQNWPYAIAWQAMLAAAGG